jgi:protein gp37
MTGIEWTDETWNPVRGCRRVSEGCRNCYAEAVASRFSGPGMPYEGLASEGRWTGAVRLVPERLDQPLRWRKPRRIFVNSMSDLFHEGLADEQIEAVFGVMAACPRHTFQVLTKRPERMREWFSTPSGLETRQEGVAREAERIAGVTFDPRGGDGWLYPRALTIEQLAKRVRWPGWPLPNAWLGVSVENQATADERIPLLLGTPAAVRFLSVEPILGPVDLFAKCPPFYAPHLRSDRIGWVIVGGESGPNARPCDVAWIRSVVEQCREAGVPCFVKQLGALPFEGDGRHTHVSGDRDYGVVCDQGDPCPHCGKRPTTNWPRLALRDQKGGDLEEWPEDLRVREFPARQELEPFGGVGA